MTPGTIIDLDLGDGVTKRALVVAPGMGVTESLWWDRASNTVEPNGWWIPVHLRSGAAFDLAFADPESAAACARDLATVCDMDRPIADVLASHEHQLQAFIDDAIGNGRAAAITDLGNPRRLHRTDERALK